MGTTEAAPPAEPAGMAPDIFISYSSRDKTVADAVVEALEGAGMTCWIAPRNITPGVSYGEAIVHALHGTRLLLLVFSDTANESPQVLREVERAVSLRLPIIPFKIDDIPLSPSMEYFISVAHWLVATAGQPEDHFPALIEAVQRQMRGAAVPEGIRSSRPIATGNETLESAGPLTGNLPAALTSFIGREEEIAELLSLLPSSRLVTLAGAGGCGKTRLALQVASQISPAEYSDGAWLVELASLADPSLVDDTVAAVLGIAATGDATGPLAERLRDKRLLLILDTCEHLLGAVAPLAETLLKSCPHLRILTTSREPLNLTAERVWRVAPLPLPDPRRAHTAAKLIESAAVRLFVERAQFRSPRFALTDQNAVAVAQVVRRLDGIPMALELAAARVKVLPVEEIARRLDDQFRLLAGGDRTALPRQQTLRALIDWSYDLLSESEKALLRRLSVFSSGATLEAAEKVCPDADLVQDWEVLDLLTLLVDKSLVLPVEEDSGNETSSGIPRYRLPETMRAYARERLREAEGEEAEFAARHHAYFVDFAEANANLSAEGAYERMAAERDNLRGAFDGLLAAGADGWGDAVRLCVAREDVWVREGTFTEARYSVTRCLESAPPAPEGQEDARVAHLQRIAGWFAYLAHDLNEARRLNAVALTIADASGDKAGAVAALNNLALAEQAAGDPQAAREAYDKCLAIVRAGGEGVSDRVREAELLSNLGMLLAEVGDLEGAALHFEDARRLFQTGGEALHTAGVLCNLSDLSLRRRDWEAARAHSAEALRLFTALSHRLGIVFARINLAETDLGTNDPADALEQVRAAAVVCSEAGSGMMPHLATLLDLRGRALATLPDQTENALRAFLAAAVLRGRAGSEGGAVPSLSRELEAALMAEIGAEAAARVRREVEGLTEEDITALAANS